MCVASAADVPTELPTKTVPTAAVPMCAASSHRTTMADGAIGAFVGHAPCDERPRVAEAAKPGPVIAEPEPDPDNACTKATPWFCGPNRDPPDDDAPKTVDVPKSVDAPKSVEMARAADRRDEGSAVCVMGGWSEWSECSARGCTAVDSCW